MTDFYKTEEKKKKKKAKKCTFVNLRPKRKKNKQKCLSGRVS